ncbi:class I SAM-dependent methyltransferase [Mycobacterium barrassiae]|uniref:class I SAM-dependent methyltransferase n=1 Tax=Mycobacterium barrassiae TaxID=319709 RepID=UPI002265ACDE|nr:class I SAM-dependent methyltransferase [Mycobacterium barrassiae]MCV7299004.1 class I SAM-dependent methyltransferase [Mycobacterium barrassiae]
MGLATAELSPIEQTAFLTEYARALDSQWPRPILGDRLAYDVVGKIDYDFAGLGVQTSVVCQTALRAKMLDDRVRMFVADHTDAVVVDLGAGLDSGFYGVSPPPSVDWYSVDLPGTMALRDHVLPADAHSHSVPVSLADAHWPDAIPADRPTILIADGLFAFLSESQIAGIFRRITDHFASGELAFNDYGRIGLVSRIAVKLTPQKMFKDVESQWGYAGFKDAHYPQTWNPRMTLVEEASLTGEPEVELFPPWIRIPTKLMGRTKAGARKARILRYTF